MMLWLVPLLPVFAAPILGFLARRTGRRTLATAAGSLMIATGVVAAVAAAAEWRGTLLWSPLVTLRLELVPASAVFLVVVPAVAAPVLAYAAAHAHDAGLGRLLAALSLFVGAMELLVAAADLLTLLIGWEAISAFSWLLIAHRRDDAGAAADATAAFLVTRAGDLGLFLSAAVAFAGTGSFAFAGLAELDGLLLHLFAAGLLTAAAAKSAQVPFASWLFAAMSGPVPVSALLHAATVVSAGIYAVVRLHGVLGPVPWFGPAAITIGLTTALAGGLVAMFQPHSKKLLAASTSAHHGLMLVAAGAGYPGVAAAHFVAHAFFKSPLFLAVGIAERRVGSYRLHRMRLAGTRPGVVLATGVAALALAGLPPLGGAWTKEAVVGAAGHHASWAALLTALAGGLSAAYGCRLFVLMFGGELDRAPGVGSKRPGAPRDVRPPGALPAEAVPVLALAGVTLALSLLWWPGGGELVGRLLALELPPFRAREVVVSLVLVGAGLWVGWWLARTRPALGEDGAPAGLADWAGLPSLVRGGAARPALRLAALLARLDDRVLDAPPRWIGTVLPDRISPAVAAADDRVLDALPRGVATGVAERMARSAGRFDDRTVDALPRWIAARMASGLAALADTVGELSFDALPEGLSVFLGRGGRRARRLQTGFSHHYYALIVIGLGLALALLFLLLRL